MKKVHLFLLIIAVVSVSAFTVIKNETNNFSEGYNIGDTATDFTLKNVDGKMVSMSDYSDAKGFIVIFTCNTCPYSVANEDRIIALDEKYKELGFPVIAINPNNPKIQPGDSFKLMKKRAEEKKFTFPYLFDEKQNVFPKYGATKTPHVYILHKEKEDLIVKYIGAIDDSSRNPATVKTKYVENAVDALLGGKPVPVTKTKAIGCGIKA